MKTGGTIRTVIAKVASRCNLNCTYCYIYNHEDKSFLSRPRFMSDEVFESMLSRMLTYCDRRTNHTLSLVFHGGEPTLMPPDVFDRLAECAQRVLGKRLRSISIQTNATLIDERWVRIFRRHNIGVGVSLDGPPAVHDAARVDLRGHGSYAKTMAGIRMLREGGINPNILCVINPGHSGLEVYRHFRREAVTWMSFLLPDVSHDSKHFFYPALGPTPVADYLIPVFDEWFGEDNPNVVIGIFWDLIQRLLGGSGSTDAFGNPLMTYVIVETDGSIEALDALRVCEQGLANSGLNVLTREFDDVQAHSSSLLAQALGEGFPLAPVCQRCQFRDVCGGGFLPHRYSRANGFNNPSVWCQDILKLLRHIRERIEVAIPA